MMMACGHDDMGHVRVVVVRMIIFDFVSPRMNGEEKKTSNDYDDISLCSSLFRPLPPRV